MKIKRKHKIMLYLFFSFILYITFIILDILKMNSSIFKYSGIIMNFIFILSFLISDKKIDNIPLSIGLFFTIISDYFLLLKNTEVDYLIGVSFFIIVQISYFVRFLLLYKLNKERCRYLIITISMRLILFSIAIVIIKNYFNEYLNDLNLIVIFYFILLLGNFVDSIYLIRNKNSFYFILF